MTNLLLGILIGMATNLLSWWILFHGIRPVIQFSEFISVVRYGPKGSNESNPRRYRVKVQNRTWRDMVDVEFRAELFLRHLDWSPNTHIVKVPLSIDGALHLNVPIVSGWRPGKIPGNRVIWIHADLISRIDSRFVLPANLSDSMSTSELTLDQWLRLGEGSSIRIAVFGYDGVSGARRLFLSKHYTALDLREGWFKRRSLKLEGDASQSPQVRAENS